MPRPNILLLFPDQHRPDWLGWNPELPLRTPNLERLAARGVRFLHAYTDSPICAPARAALASGRGYARCRVPDNHSDFPLDLPTYYQALRSAGYRVAGVGKFDLHKDTRDPSKLDWHLDGSRCLAEWGFTDGIDNEGKIDGSASYRACGGPRGPYLAHLAERGLADVYCEEHARMRENLGAYTTALPEDAYCDNWLTENGLRLLRSFPSGQPWHLVVNFTGPHNPFDVTARMRAAWEGVDFPPPRSNDRPNREGFLRCRQNYAAMIENIDRLAARFLAAVEERGELENTLVVYASDHGEMLGDQGRWGKCHWREASAGIPLIVAGPGVREGSVSDAVVSLRDLAATFLDYADAPYPPGMDASSLRPVLEGQRCTHRRVAVCGLDDWWLASDGRHKLVRQNGQPDRLFDLAEDPWEEHDIAAERPEVVARLALDLAAESRSL
jgi:arylsulfatase A-like enzyme